MKRSRGRTFDAKRALLSKGGVHRTQLHRRQCMVAGLAALGLAACALNTVTVRLTLDTRKDAVGARERRLRRRMSKDASRSRRRGLTNSAVERVRAWTRSSGIGSSGAKSVSKSSPSRTRACLEDPRAERKGSLAPAGLRATAMVMLAAASSRNFRLRRSGDRDQ